MERRFELKRMYRLLNGTKDSEVYFTSEVEAERYKNMCESFGEIIYLSVWSWNVQIEM